MVNDPCILPQFLNVESNNPALVWEAKGESATGTPYERGLMLGNG